MKKLLASYISEFILSDKRLIKNRMKAEKTRDRLKQPHILDIYIAIDDPVSYLLLQVLPELKQRYNLTFKFKTVLSRQDEMFPESELWNENALNDSIRMANLYQLTPPKTFSLDEILVQDVSLLLTQLETQSDFLSIASEIFHAVWQHNMPVIEKLIVENLASELFTLKKRLSSNENELMKKGHYLSGVVHYQGEWYWGLERLQYLEKRLNSLFSLVSKTVKYDKLHDLYKPLNEPIKDKTTPLTIYFSIRSPYSYLGILRAIKLTEHYQIPLLLKPVLPMLMRGMQVPRKKSLYIALDTKREANAYQITFGKIADPLGAGVARCYALFDYAKSQDKEIVFMKNYATAVWSQRVFSETDKGLKQIVEHSGLDWQTAQSYLNDETWREWADENLKELFSLGLWGVPSFRYKNTHVFGQDKLLFIEQIIRNEN